MTNRFIEKMQILQEAQAKKDFVATAKILKDHKDKMSKEVHAQLVHAMATHHAASNPAFKHAVYNKAAGLED